MESESSDLLRFPTAGEATRLGCAWGRRERDFDSCRSARRPI